MISSCVCCLEKITLCEIEITDNKDVDCGLSDLMEARKRGHAQSDGINPKKVICLDDVKKAKTRL
jgi:hypothetical protein